MCSRITIRLDAPTSRSRKITVMSSMPKSLMARGAWGRGYFAADGGRDGDFADSNTKGKVTKNIRMIKAFLYQAPDIKVTLQEETLWLCGHHEP